MRRADVAGDGDRLAAVRVARSDQPADRLAQPLGGFLVAGGAHERVDGALLVHKQAGENLAAEKACRARE